MLDKGRKSFIKQGLKLFSQIYVTVLLFFIFFCFGSNSTLVLNVHHFLYVQDIKKILFYFKYSFSDTVQSIQMTYVFLSMYFLTLLGKTKSVSSNKASMFFTNIRNGFTVLLFVFALKSIFFSNFHYFLYFRYFKKISYVFLSCSDIV